MAGAGVVDSVVSSHIAGNGGFGLKFFLGGRSRSGSTSAITSSASSCWPRPCVVNDISTTLGVSIYLPMRE